MFTYLYLNQTDIMFMFIVYTYLDLNIKEMCSYIKLYNDPYIFVHFGMNMTDEEICQETAV